MGGLDELVDDVEDDTEQQEVEGMMDELDIENKEDLEQLQDRLEGVNQGLMNYDRRMERIEDRLTVLEKAVAQLLRDDDENETQKQSNEEEEQSDDGQSGGNNDGFDW